VRVLFSVGFEPGPDFVGNEEVISFNFSCEGELRDTEVSITVSKVIVIFRIFV